MSGLYLSGHPLDAYRSQIAQVSTCTIAQLLGEDAKQFDNQNVTLVCTIVREQDHDHEIQHADGVYDRGGSDRQYGTACIPAHFGRMPCRPCRKMQLWWRTAVFPSRRTRARLIVEGVQSIETYDPAQSFGRNRVERVKRETSGEGPPAIS